MLEIRLCQCPVLEPEVGVLPGDVEAAQIITIQDVFRVVVKKSSEEVHGQVEDKLASGHTPEGPSETASLNVVGVRFGEERLVLAADPKDSVGYQATTEKRRYRKSESDSGACDNVLLTPYSFLEIGGFEPA